MFRAIICLILVSTVVCFYKSTFLGKKISRNMLKMDISDARVGRALVATTVAAALSLGLGQASALADEIKVVPQYTQKRSDLQAYTDINRGFQMKRPFGFNEFEGAGGGYLVKFASLFDVDENVVVGSAPASAGKTSITDYGDIKELGEKLASKRNGKLLETEARQTSGTIFYKFKFETPLDANLPRTGPKNNRPTTGVELYELCVAKGRLWSVSATSNNVLFEKSEPKFQASLYSFLPRL